MVMIRGDAQSAAVKVQVGKRNDVAMRAVVIAQVDEVLIAKFDIAATEPLRRGFLQETYRRSRELLIHVWIPGYEHEPAF